MTKPIILLLLREDLRLDDHQPLHMAVEESIGSGALILPVYVLEESFQLGEATLSWLYRSLYAYKEAWKRVSRGEILVMRGSRADALKLLLEQFNVHSIYSHECYHPKGIQADIEAARVAKAHSIPWTQTQGALLIHPKKFLNRQGQPYRVFTPFWRSMHSIYSPKEIIPVPEGIIGVSDLKGSCRNQQISPLIAISSEMQIEKLGCKPKIDWDRGFYQGEGQQGWEPGEAGAWKLLNAFYGPRLREYAQERNFPAKEGTSRLSPHLRFGEISLRRLYRHLQQMGTDAEPFLRQLGWKEFASHLLWHYPELLTRPMRREFEAFPWRDDPVGLVAWQKGKTGYPIVDAGMRQLWQTGWMHNRVRMIVASFLVKDLLIDYKHGEAWFWDTLLDADFFNNSMGWQWVAGCGVDAAPYFRIFNPYLQAQRFDPTGEYIRTYLPELATLPTAYLHDPTKATQSHLRECGVQIGVHYPEPIIEHRLVKERALTAYRAISLERYLETTGDE
jgi:deoxyribodipyrimidine photo-lyase